MKKLYVLLIVLLHITNASAQWVLQNTGFTTASRGIRDISIVSPQVAWALAYDGSGAAANTQDYTRTTNGGTTWVAGTISATGITNFNNANISATTADSAWVALYGPSGGGRIYRTANGGTSWTQQNTTGYTGAASFLNFVHFFDSQNGVSMGDPEGGWHEVYTTSNAGATWTRVPITSMPAPISADEWGIVNTYSAVGNTIWFGTIFGRIYKSTNRGLNWTVHTTGFTGTTSVFALDDVEFSDASNGLVKNGTAIRRTTDGGLTWSAVSYTGPLYATDLGAVKGTAGSFASVATGSSYTLNGGTTWIPINTGTQYNKVEFNSPSLGWAGAFSQAGGTGGIYKWSGPALVTTQDVGISSISSPATQLCNATNQLVCVVIANTGNTPQSGFQVSYTLNGGTPVTETYNGTLQAGATVSHCFSTVANFAAAGTYTLAASALLTGDTNPGNNQTSANITSTVSPALTVSPATAICAGQSATLTVSGANTYVWQPGGLTGSSITVSPTATTTYTVTGSTGGSCNSTATATVTVNASPAVAATASPASICAGETAVLSATGASTYVWTPGTATGSTTSVSPTATTTYSIVGTDANGCTAGTSVTVAVTSATSVSVAPVAAICAGQTTTLVASGANSYTWQPGGQTGASVSVSPTGTTTYTVTGSSGSGCSGTATTTVTVNAAPAAPAVTNNGPLCEGATLQLSATGPGSGSYTWASCGFTSFDQNPVLPNITPAQASCLFTVTFTDVNGCTSAAATTAALVNPTPAAPVATNNGPVCAGDTVQLSATGPAGVFYSWTGCNTFTSTLQNPVIMNATAANSCSYSVFVTDTNGCQSPPATSSLVVNPNPPLTILNNSPVCTTDTIFLQAISSPGATFSWNGVGINSNLQNPIIVSPTPVASVPVIVTATLNGCTTTDTTYYVGILAPNPIGFTHIVSGNTVNVSVIPPSWGIQHPLSWNTPGGTLTNNSIYYPNPGTYVITLITHGQSGCNSSFSATVSIITGTENELNLRTQVYPNPTNGLIHVKLPSECTGKLSLQLFNVLGQELHIPAAKTSGELIDLDLGSLAEGAYLLQIETQAGLIRKQVLLQK